MLPLSSLSSELVLGEKMFNEASMAMDMAVN